MFGKLSVLRVRLALQREVIEHTIFASRRDIPLLLKAETPLNAPTHLLSLVCRPYPMPRCLTMDFLHWLLQHLVFL